eukprot:UN12798
MIAIHEKKIVGFLSTTKVFYVFNNKQCNGLCLAPLAVHPQYQMNGVGSKMINELINRYKNKSSCVYLTVLGAHKYYNRFGFASAYKFGLKCKWDYPKEAFMI